MRTMEQWHGEWEELYDTLPPYRPGDPVLVRRAREMLSRAHAIFNWMHGFGPEPPEEWSPTDPPTPEEVEEARAWNLAQFEKGR